MQQEMSSLHKDFRFEEITAANVNVRSRATYAIPK